MNPIPTDRFLRNRYANLYRNLIERAASRETPNGYTEKHHVLPRSMGGLDTQANLVLLTAKEHFVAHHLLTKMCVSDSDRTKMHNAFFLMHAHSTKNRYYNGRTYQYSKLQMSLGKKELTGERNHFFGKTHSPETRQKMKLKRVGRVCRYDPTENKFFHLQHGLVISTQQNFYTNYFVCRKGVNYIVKNENSKHRGWVVLK